MMKHFRTAAIMTMMTMALAAGATTAFAAETGNSYGYQIGQQQGRDRHAQFEEAAGPFSDAQHLDVEEFVAAGILDQETADRIAENASAKHDRLHNRYADKSSMTPEELHTFYEGIKSDGFNGDSVQELLDQGLITQEQADAMNEYMQNRS